MSPKPEIPAVRKPASAKIRSAKKPNAVPPPPEKSGRLNLPKGVLLGAHTSISGGVAQAIPRAQTPLPLPHGT